MKFKCHYDVITIVILISILVSCGKDEKKQTITVPIDAQAGSIYLEPDIYTVEEKDFKSHSGIIVVPENRSKPNSRLIEIPIVQMHATGDSVARGVFLNCLILFIIVVFLGTPKFIAIDKCTFLIGNFIVLIVSFYAWVRFERLTNLCRKIIFETFEHLGYIKNIIKKNK